MTYRLPNHAYLFFNLSILINLVWLIFSFVLSLTTSVSLGGEYRIRTDDPLLAKQVL